MKFALTSISGIPDADPFKDYVSNLLSITAYQYALSNVNWPNLSFTGIGEASYTEALAKYNDYTANDFPLLKSHAMVWINSVLPAMLSSPNVTVNNNNLFSASYRNIETYLEGLIEDPSDDTYKQSAIKELKFLVSICQNNEKVFTNSNPLSPGIIEALQTFITDFKSDLDKLTLGVTDINNLITADKQMIAAFTAEITALQNQIDTLNNDIAWDAIALAGAVALTLLGVGLAPEGLILAAIGVAGVAYFSYKTAKNKAELKLATVNINNDQKGLAELDQDAQVLNGMAHCITNIEGKYITAMNGLQETSGMWVALNNELIVVIADIQTVLNDASAAQPDYKTMLTEIQAAQSEWADLENKAAILANLNIKYNDATNIQMLDQD